MVIFSVIQPTDCRILNQGWTAGRGYLLAIWQGMAIAELECAGLQINRRARIHREAFCFAKIPAASNVPATSGPVFAMARRRANNELYQLDSNATAQNPASGTSVKPRHAVV
ncbi:MAG: hypothetical protein WDN00_15735 [Limisphaerales bacterium]